LFYLLQFDGLVEQATTMLTDGGESAMDVVEDDGMKCVNNYQCISKVVWHSLWNASGSIGESTTAFVSSNSGGGGGGESPAASSDEERYSYFSKIC
jgi:hypothetical protein